MKKKIDKFRTWEMFNEITNNYDMINHIMSLGMVFSWRNKLSKKLHINDGDIIVDLCCGTGDQLFSVIRNNFKKSFRVIGVDMSEKMLDIAKQKINKRELSKRVTLTNADATKLPFDNFSIDAITISFGIRNVENTNECLQEVYRVLKSNGSINILESSIPKNKLIKFFHKLYLKIALPVLVALFTKNRKAYKYLSETMLTFPSNEEFIELLNINGFSKSKQCKLNFGAIAIYSAVK